MEAFHYLTNIDYIYFHKTKIGRIERKAFSKMYQIDHLYFKDSVEIGMIESEAFSGSQVDEFIMDGVSIESAHDTFLLNIDSEKTILKNCSVYFVPKKEDLINVTDEQKMIERCLMESSTFNIMSPYKLGCNVLEVTSSIIQRIGPVSRDIDTPALRPESCITTSLNSIIFSNCTIGTIDSLSFSNYTLSILRFHQSSIENIKSRAIEKSHIQHLGFRESQVKTINGSSIHKSVIKIFNLDGMEINLIQSDWILNSSIQKMKLSNSKIGTMEKNIFNNSIFEKVEIDGNRMIKMDSAAFHGDNQISTLSITANDLTTSTPSPSLLSAIPSSHPTSFLFANNTIDCSPTDCSTNSFLLNSPKHAPLLYQISHNRCRPPIQSPCVESRSISLEDHGIACRISSLVADCACVSKMSSIPSKFPMDSNVSIVILGDCEHLTIHQSSQRQESFSQIYIFRTTKLIIKSLPRSLKILKIFHSTLSLVDPSDSKPSRFPQSWEISNSKIDRIDANGLANLKIVTLHLKFSRLPHIAMSSTKNSKIGNLIIENCFLESTQPLFEISSTLKMQNSIIFSAPRGLGAITSAQLQNNSLLECCRHAYLDYRIMSLGTIDLDPRCDLHFSGSRCFSVEAYDGADVSKTHLPSTSFSILCANCLSVLLVFPVYLAIRYFL